MSLLRKTVNQTLVFSAFRAAGILVSLISFPVLTRQLTVSEYGSLAIINASVTMLAAVAKCGLGMAMLRQFPVAARENHGHPQLIAAAFWGTLSVWAAVALFYFFVASRYVASTARLDVILSSMVVVMAASSALSDLFSALLRGRDQILRSSMFGTALKIVSVGSGLVSLAFAERKLMAFCIGSLSAELLMLGGAWLREALAGNLSPWRSKQADRRALFAFGMPLVMFEFASIANDYLDRFQIAHFLGLDAVGIYSVGYNIASYAQTVTTWPLWMALFPIYTRLWEKEGAQAVSDFLSKFVPAFWAAACAVVMYATACSEPAIAILAGRRFTAAAAVLPVVCAAMMINGMTHLTGAGIYLKRRTALLAAVAASGALLKASLNLALIPRFGIDGAAYATLGSYALITAAITLLGQKLLRVHWPFARSVGYAALAAASAYLATFVVLENPFALIAVRGLLVSICYFGGLLLVDRRLRETIKAFRNPDVTEKPKDAT